MVDCQASWAGSTEYMVSRMRYYLLWTADPSDHCSRHHGVGDLGVLHRSCEAVIFENHV